MTFNEWKQPIIDAGGIAWVEEQLARGRPSGSINGGHVIFGGELNGRRFFSDPLPLTTDVGDTEFAVVLGALNVAAIAERDALAKQVASLTVECDSSRRGLDVATARIAELTADVAALGTTEQAQAIRKAARIKELEQQQSAVEAELAQLKPAQGKGKP